MNVIQPPIRRLSNNRRAIIMAHGLQRSALLASILQCPFPDLLKDSAETGRVGECDWHIGEAPIFDLVGSTDFAVAVECVHAGVAGDRDVIWSAGEDYGYSAADGTSVFSNSCLTDSNSCDSVVSILISVFWK